MPNTAQHTYDEIKAACISLIRAGLTPNEHRLRGLGISGETARVRRIIAVAREEEGRPVKRRLTGFASPDFQQRRKTWVPDDVLDESCLRIVDRSEPLTIAAVRREGIKASNERIRGAIHRTRRAKIELFPPVDDSLDRSLDKAGIEARIAAVRAEKEAAMREGKRPGKGREPIGCRGIGPVSSRLPLRRYHVSGSEPVERDSELVVREEEAYRDVEWGYYHSRGGEQK